MDIIISQKDVERFIIKQLGLSDKEHSFIKRISVEYSLDNVIKQIKKALGDLPFDIEFKTRTIPAAHEVRFGSQYVHMTQIFTKTAEEPEEDNDSFIRIIDAADKLGVNRQTVMNWANRGKIEVEKRGSRVFVRESDVLDLMPKPRFAFPEPDPVSTDLVIDNFLNVVRKGDEK